LHRRQSCARVCRRRFCRYRNLRRGQRLLGPLLARSCAARSRAETCAASGARARRSCRPAPQAEARQRGRDRAEAGARVSESFKLSAIVACYLDERAIPIMAERLEQTFAKIGCEYEMIFVNDGSPDDSQAVLERLAAANPRIKVITHSRNFGSQNAFTSGMARASGDACILLDGDLQDPPALIEEVVARWREGFEVVYGIRTRREMAWRNEVLYKAFYRLFQRVAYI